MVTQPLHASRAHKKRRGILTRKLFRDMRRSAMQFIAMMLLCFLGTWCFDGLDANWRTMQNTFDTYFSENNIADFWVKGGAVSKLDQMRLEHMPFVDKLVARTNLTVDCPDLGDNVSLNLIAYEGEMTINTPRIQSGEALDPGDIRGILLEKQFAEANGLSPGDRIKVDVIGQPMVMIIRGTVLSPEYIVTSKDVTPTPKTFGFALINRCAVQFLPINELLLRLVPGTDEAAAKAEIAGLMPESLIITVGTNGGTATAKSFVGMFRSLSYLFPVLVYAIATMIVISTLTRMIENQRIQMGTLKAMGFPGRKIRNHYLSYALVPSVVGSVAGTLAGHYTLPDVIWEMLMHNARLPYMLRPPISALSWVMCIATVLLSLLVCLYVYRKAARETTANLLRPKPPKSGTRILLERWHWLWSRLSFNTKMIIRNIFRNKGRTLMSFVGVFCCNMLIVCSFSLQDSIPAFIQDYFTGTHAYDIEAVLDTSAGVTLESCQTRLDAEIIEGIMEISISATGPKQTRACLMTVIPEGQTLLHLGPDQTLMAMPENGVCISEKLGRLLGLGLGDTITIYITGDDEPLLLTIQALAETNIGQGVFISRHAWELCRKGRFMPTSLIMKGMGTELLRELDAMDEVTTLKYPAVQNKQTQSIMDSTTTMFGILSGAALFLAFIICYNMGLMNFTERTRDYATLKVLGYHQKEIRRIMMREQEVIAVVATVLSVWPGMLLTRIILKMCEYDSMVFVPAYTLPSLAKACLISVSFAWLIQRFLTRKVKTINMVEALKSVE